MFKSHLGETLLGAAIALFAIGFFAFMRWQTGTGSLSGYEIKTIMTRADGVAVGTDVKIAGLTIGRITEVTLEPNTYRVRIRMEIRSDIGIPVDSSLSVASSMMTSPYLSVRPGQRKQTVEPGGTLR